jgi:superfamily I DNA/RNA helicase
VGADKYQQAVLDWVSSKQAAPGERQTLVVEALAGTGKTWTITKCCELLSGVNGRKPSVAVVAFNKDIVAAVKPRLEGTGVHAMTCHQMGFAAICYALQRERVKAPSVDGRKYDKLCASWHKQIRDSGFIRFPGGTERGLTQPEREAIGDKPRSWVSDVLRLFTLGRDGLIDFSRSRAVEAIAKRHRIELAEEILPLTVQALGELASWAKRSHDTIDFADMVWLPIVRKWSPRPRDWLFVDEAQDLSAARLELLLMARGRGGRIVFVGDPNQAINAFAGADSRAFSRIISRTQADVLPLSICYRCPTSVLDLARELCPQIEARPDAPEGEVVELQPHDLTWEVQEGDMVLCRRTAPLISTAFELVGNGIPVCVRGSDIAEGLVALATKVAASAVDMDAGFESALQSWLADQRDRILAHHDGDQDLAQSEIANARDQAKCVQLLWARVRQTNGGVEQLEREIGRIFSTKATSSVTLSTIHRAKGLENPTVYVLDSDRLPRARTAYPGTQAEQEENLAYVAFTRAQQRLVLVTKGEAA